MIGLLRKLLGSRNDRMLRRLNKSVQKINTWEKSFQALDDAALRAKTEEFRARLAQGSPLDSLLPEAFAVVREAGRRVMGMRHFDMQLVGGMVLHEGKIAEMRTGEGKTLVATLTAYLNALPGKGVHVITVNDYLARRDAEWMGQLYGFLGLSVGVIVSGLSQEERRAAYAADITYGTNNEFGFDYLRDNMVFTREQQVQRGLNYAVVDEVDSILIDEARTPLIISGPTDDKPDLYVQLNRVIPHLTRQKSEEGEGDYWVDEKARQAHLSEQGHQHAEAQLIGMGLLAESDSLYSVGNILLMHHLHAALRAHALFQRDVDYVVKDGQILIVDEFTGRIMAGRRWSEGLHQAIEAKESVPIQQETQTLASITFQNYFRMYGKLAGMTGTADTEAYEFQQIYGLEVVVIPPHRPMVRKDMGDLVYLSAKEKYQAIVADVRDCYERGQPVLVGTASIESSEQLAQLLHQAQIPHEVLNAKQHEREAQIIAQAGKLRSVTIATNMAGRGTDIVLGGSLRAELENLGAQREPLAEAQIRREWEARHEQVVKLGGLHITGTERHESRRIDNQLRGRAGRQGDPGSSRFYLALDDSLMRIFASDQLAGLMKRLGMQESEAIEHPWVSKAIENAQRKVETRNFDIRKQLLEYDDVANDQRKVIYNQRNELMDASEIASTVAAMRDDVLTRLVDSLAPPNRLEDQWKLEELRDSLARDHGLQLDLQAWLQQDANLEQAQLRTRILQAAEQVYGAKETIAGAPALRHFEKSVMLQTVDHHWKEHLAAMDYLRQGIHLRGYAQKNPKQEYKREAFEMFTQMLEDIKLETVRIMSLVQVRSEQAMAEAAEPPPPVNMQYAHDAPTSVLGADPEPPVETVAEQAQAARTEPFAREGRKVGRNEACPCGSGKKYKQCHGRLG
jgi:preprotein translocase subunit SecA